MSFVLAWGTCVVLGASTVNETFVGAARALPFITVLSERRYSLRLHPEIKRHVRSQIAGQAVPITSNDDRLIDILRDIVQHHPPPIILDPSPSWSLPYVFQLPVQEPELPLRKARST